jgi:hypothetical protein
VKQLVDEGVDVAKQLVYTAPISAESPAAAVSLPTPEYRTKARQAAEQRAILAGRRLARLLNESFK